MARQVSSLAAPDELTQRALIYVVDRRVVRSNYREYLVEQKSRTRAHIVRRKGGRWTCTCKTNKVHDHVCVHIRATELAIRLDQVSPLPVAQTPTKPAENFPADNATRCSHCGSQSYRCDGSRQTRDGRKVQRYECKTCGRKFCNDVGFGRRWYSPEQIEEAVELRISGFSLKQVAEHFRLRGKPVPSTVTVYRWQRRYGKLAADYMESNTPPITDSWMADETTVFVNGETHWTWNFIDPKSRAAFASPTTRTKDTKDGVYAVLAAKKIAGGAPRYFVTDGFAVYDNVSRKHLWRKKKPTTHVVSTPIPGLKRRHGESKDKGVNLVQNRIERYNGTQRTRTNLVRGFKSLESAREFLRLFRVGYNMLRPHEALDGRTPAQALGMKLPTIDGGATLRAILIEQHRREWRKRLNLDGYGAGS